MFFSKQEAKMIGVILLVVFGATAINLTASIRKARDARRKLDIRNVSRALEGYKGDFASFPKSSSENKILLCEPVEFDELGVPKFSPCRWGEDSLADLADPSYPAYLDSLPTDPHEAKGVSYLYISNGNRYQLLAALESEKEAEYDPKIKARGLECGNQICNFGLSFASPLDKSIQEYENELRDAEQ